MNITSQRKEIHHLIEEVDNETVIAVHSLLTKIKEVNSFELTNAEIKQLDKEYSDYKKGITKGYSLEEAKKLISIKK
ncbi:MAG TPA: hypothetical protein PLJ42_04775 [Chitinophagales bacterium]|jgi:hypothetical protein|nr:hypothetical protein [Chitinophagales bacterium]HQV78006.1 hypothetical protein [Chitinophagales bacterium]HQW78728.1 hypothetical protein [Chitinophagales bacterium]HRB67986.1 hypothetical protein [Chitinophagales bacterium]